jgi:hypothetical protein
MICPLDCEVRFVDGVGKKKWTGDDVLEFIFEPGKGHFSSGELPVPVAMVFAHVVSGTAFVAAGPDGNRARRGQAYTCGSKEKIDTVNMRGRKDQQTPKEKGCFHLFKTWVEKSFKHANNFGVHQMQYNGNANLSLHPDGFS